MGAGGVHIGHLIIVLIEGYAFWLILVGAFLVIAFIVGVVGYLTQ